jgi:hypothetical protein
MYEQTLPQKGQIDSKEVHEKTSTFFLFVIREMQIKTTMKNHQCSWQLYSQLPQTGNSLDVLPTLTKNLWSIQATVDLTGRMPGASHNDRCQRQVGVCQPILEKTT